MLHKTLRNLSALILIYEEELRNPILHKEFCSVVLKQNRAMFSKKMGDIKAFKKAVKALQKTLESEAN